ncbi:MAG UNVERIFIED_CONTAM: glutamine synthetase [Planctomycetaceae bacterium]|jgi:glutamine synthetase
MSESQLSPREVLALCRQREIQAIDLRFTDFCGTLRHFTIPAGQLSEDSFEQGFAFDGSSMRGWQAIHESDMLVVPESQTCFVDPFMKSTVALLCNVRDPVTHQTYPARSAKHRPEGRTVVADDGDCRPTDGVRRSRVFRF